MAMVLDLEKNRSLKTLKIFDGDLKQWPDWKVRFEAVADLDGLGDVLVIEPAGRASSDNEEAAPVDSATEAAMSAEYVATL